jgi:hypothetical protein
MGRRLWGHRLIEPAAQVVLQPRFWTGMGFSTRGLRTLTRASWSLR